ncbi:hypothetical protein AB205_0095550, partial [Aquarana catesbeiana]
MFYCYCVSLYLLCRYGMSYCYIVMLLCFIVNHYLLCRYAIQLQHGFIYFDSNMVYSYDTYIRDSSAVGGDFTTTV